ncbi:hypothetical protein BsWGS_15498 [Bradybaena similaris]
MTSSRSSDPGGRTESSGSGHHNSPAMLKEELRQSIMAKRQARGEKLLKIEYTEPEQMELTPAELEKKERRREQNRRAAQRCRHKKRINQKHVIQNYEQVVARNEQLQKELDAATRELNKLRNTCSHHMCCPSFGKVKQESDPVIKVELMSVEEQQHVTKAMTPCSSEYYSSLAPADNISRFVPKTLYTHACSSQPDKRTTDSGVLTFPKKQQQAVIQSETDFLQPQQPHSTDSHQEYSGSYGLVPDISPDLAAFLVSAQLRGNSHKYFRREKQEYQPQPQQLINIQNAENTVSVQRPDPVQMATMSSTQPANTQAYTFLEHGALIQLQNAPCQVVPSLRSPRPDSVASTVSCSYDTTRHRSLSGGSGCASYTPPRCRNEREFSSVSSEGSLSMASMYQDLRTLEAPDMDTDDVFINPMSGSGVPLDGHDDNNNLISIPDNNLQAVSDNNLVAVSDNNIVAVPDNMAFDPQLLQLFTQATPSVIDWLNTTADSTSLMDEAPAASDTGTTDSDDVSTLIQLSSADLQLFTEIDSSEQPYDILSTILDAAQRIDY